MIESNASVSQIKIHEYQPAENYALCRRSRANHVDENFTDSEFIGIKFYLLCPVRNAFLVSSQNFSQVPAPLPCDSIGITNLFKACFVNVLVQWLSTREIAGATPAFRIVVNLWGAKDLKYNDDALVCSYRYKYVV